MLGESERGQELFGLEPSPRPGAHRRSLRERSALPCAGGSVVFLPCPLAAPTPAPRCSFQFSGPLPLLLVERHTLCHIKSRSVASASATQGGSVIPASCPSAVPDAT